MSQILAYEFFIIKVKGTDRGKTELLLESVNKP